jgi:spore coat polysaccharide biosynthesis protein SpsF
MLSRREPAVIVATTTNPDDDQIETECRRMRVNCFRGSECDVLERMNRALLAYAPEAEYVARAMADNPLVDVSLVDWRVDTLRETGADGVWYGADHERITYAGTTDVWSRSAWERIVCESDGDEREHPGLYFWNNLSRFNVVQMTLPLREYLLPIRTELDTERDLEVFRRVFAWWVRNNLFDDALPTIAALAWLGRHPDVAALNAEVPLKTQTRPHWNKGRDWLCRECSERIGAVVAGDLELRCPGCGKPQKFYE